MSTAIEIMLRQAEYLPKLLQVKKQIAELFTPLCKHMFCRSFGKRRVYRWRGKRFCVKVLPKEIAIS